MALFSSLFGKSAPASVLGIDIGSSSIKVVQLRREGGKAVLETYGELSLGPYAQTEIGRATNLPPEKLGAALKDLLRECKATASSCGLAIPFASSLISVIEIPEVSQKELQSIVPIEARKYIPVPISEVSLDWSVIPRVKGEPDFNGGDMKVNPIKNKIDVLTVAIHNDTISKYKDIMRAAGLDCSFFEIEIFSTIRALLENDPAPVMILDMGAATTKLYIIERGVIRNSHTINRGSQDLTIGLSSALGITVEEAELLKRGAVSPREGQDEVMKSIFSTMLDYIFSEAERVILTYQKKHNKDLSQVYLVGGGVKLKGFIDDVRSGLEVNCIPGNPFAKIQTPAFLDQMLNITGPEFSVAVGIALRRLQEVG
ncbi:MAG TPA: type IV pilus assembly protein PilM [Candidatus Paceibacterota bacterium]|nr:type IV pilus assembly protein PilM [Candidatus Paceibacterota bacterium]